MANDQKTEPTPTITENFDQKLKNIGKQIAKVAVDFTTLNVTTLTGNYSHMIVKKEGTKKKIKTNFHDFTKILGQPTAVDANIKMIAHTHIDFDHDTVNFIDENVDPSDDFLFNIHKSALDSAKTSRTGFIRMLKELI